MAIELRKFQKEDYYCWADAGEKAEIGEVMDVVNGEMSDTDGWVVIVDENGIYMERFKVGHDDAEVWMLEIKNKEVSLAVVNQFSFRYVYQELVRYNFQRVLW
jgi:hypothetical protein